MFAARAPGREAQLERAPAIGGAGDVHEGARGVVPVNGDAPVFPQLDRARRGVPRVALVDHDDVLPGVPVGAVQLAGFHPHHDGHVGVGELDFRLQAAQLDRVAVRLDPLRPGIGEDAFAWLVRMKEANPKSHALPLSRPCTCAAANRRSRRRSICCT